MLGVVAVEDMAGGGDHVVFAIFSVHILNKFFTLSVINCVHVINVTEDKAETEFEIFWGQELFRTKRMNSLQRIFNIDLKHPI